MLRSFVLFVSCISTACGSTGASQRTPAAEPQPLEADAPPTPEPIVDGGPMDLARAKRIVAELEAQWPLREDHPLREPMALEDAEKILKSDQVRLFPFAVRYLEQQEGRDPLAMRGQIELAWGEAYMLLMEMLAGLRKDFTAAAEDLGARTDLGPEDEHHLAWLRDSLQGMETRIEAFKFVAVEHITTGSQVADEVLNQHPDNYLGYRLAADYYRTLRDWENFGEMVARIKQTNPKSNGLLFLLGAEALQAKQDRSAAESYYRKALANDPDFVRAQAHLLIIQSDLERTHAELLKLEALNPEHQFVALAGESIKRAFESRGRGGGS